MNWSKSYATSSGSLQKDKEEVWRFWPSPTSFACGNPFGLAFDNAGRTSVTYGVVSALGRQMTQRLTADTEKHYYGNLIMQRSRCKNQNCPKILK